MLFLAKLFGILTLVWFYMSAKKLGAPCLNWSIIGLVGYWLSWWLAKILILVPLAALVPQHSILEMLLTQSPAFCAVAVCYLIRQQLISKLPPAAE